MDIRDAKLIDLAIDEWEETDFGLLVGWLSEGAQGSFVAYVRVGRKADALRVTLSSNEHRNAAFENTS
jgi:hypothetical protein